jgi:hypothetical protein
MRATGDNRLREFTPNRAMPSVGHNSRAFYEKKITTAYSRYKSLSEDSIRGVLELGHWLNEAKSARTSEGKDLIPYSEWGPWMGQFPFHQQTGRNYMRLATWAGDDLDKIKMILDLGIADSLDKFITKHVAHGKEAQIEGDEASGGEEQQAARDSTLRLVRLLRRELSRERYKELVRHTQSADWSFLKEALWDSDIRRVKVLPKNQRGHGLTKIFVDSGTFSAFNSRSIQSVNMDDYCEFLLQNPWIDVYANFDHIDPDDPERAAATNFDILLYMRSRGLDPIAVYHVREDVSWLHKMLDIGCAYIGLSATSIGGRIEGDRWYEMAWSHLVNDAGHPKVRTHAFGETRLQILTRFPWTSADSSSWVNGMRWGTIKYSTLPIALSKEKGQRGLAARAYTAAQHYVQLEREVQKTNSDFEFFYAIAGNVWGLPTLHAVGHRKALASFAYLKSNRSLVTDLPKFIEEPYAVLNQERHAERHRIIQDIRMQDKDYYLIQQDST